MTQTPESESARKKSRRTPSRCSLVCPLELNQQAPAGCSPWIILCWFWFWRLSCWFSKKGIKTVTDSDSGVWVVDFSRKALSQYLGKSISCVVSSLTVPYYFSLYYIDHKVIFCVRIIALFQYSLPYNYKGLLLVAGATSTFSALRLRNTKVILIEILRVSHIRCYCHHYYFSW